MQIREAIQSMNMNQFEALFQTSIQMEYTSYLSGRVGLKFEGYEGSLEFDQIVARIRLAFSEAMGPFLEKIQNGTMYLSQKEGGEYGRQLELSRNLLSKIKKLYIKASEKENSHPLRKYYNKLVERQYTAAYLAGKKLLEQIEGEKNTAPFVYKKHHYEKWHQDYLEMKKGIKWHGFSISNL